MAVEYSYASIRRSIALGDVRLFRCGCLLGDGRPSCSRYGNHDGAMSGFFFLFVVAVVRPMRKFGALARCGSVGRRSAAGASLFRSAVRGLRVLRRRPVLCSKRNGKNIPECRSAPKCTEAAAGGNHGMRFGSVCGARRSFRTCRDGCVRLSSAVSDGLPSRDRASRRFALCIFAGLPVSSFPISGLSREMSF